jgi:hypothetical protein
MEVPALAAVDSRCLQVLLPGRQYTTGAVKSERSGYKPRYYGHSLVIGYEQRLVASYLSPNTWRPRVPPWPRIVSSDHPLSSQEWWPGCGASTIIHGRIHVVNTGGGWGPPNSMMPQSPSRPHRPDKKVDRPAGAVRTEEKATLTFGGRPVLTMGVGLE